MKLHFFCLIKQKSILIVQYDIKIVETNTSAWLQETNSFPLIVITFLFTKLPWLGASEGTFSLRVKLLSVLLLTTHCVGFTLSLVMLIVKRKSCRYLFHGLWFDPPGIEPMSVISVADLLTQHADNIHLFHMFTWFGFWFQCLFSLFFGEGGGIFHFKREPETVSKM